MDRLLHRDASELTRVSPELLRRTLDLLAGQQAVRVSVFADAGQIYAEGLQPDFESFRFSAGLGLAWNSPLGPLKFSYAYPVNEKTGDKVQRFQFQVGSVF